MMAMNMAVEMMCHAYTLSHYRATKNEEAFRLYSLMDNVPMEYGKQQASLSGWENSAIFNIVSENRTDLNATLLSESEFGLWFRHKCVRYFNHNPQMAEITELIGQVDALITEWRTAEQDAGYKILRACCKRSISIASTSAASWECYSVVCRRCKTAKTH